MVETFYNWQKPSHRFSHGILLSRNTNVESFTEPSATFYNRGSPKNDSRVNFPEFNECRIHRGNGALLFSSGFTKHIWQNNSRHRSHSDYKWSFSKVFFIQVMRPKRAIQEADIIRKQVLINL